MSRISSIVLWLVAAFYAYGALVHVLNIAGSSGFVWREAPLKWQVLDVVYLALDLAVAGMLPRRRRPGIIAFYLAAISQVFLYTIFRSWILDVPAAFAPGLGADGYLNGLVLFHLLTLLLVTGALAWLRRSNRQDP